MKRASDNMLEAQKRVPYHSGSGLMPILLDKAGLFFMLASAAAALCSALSIL